MADTTPDTITLPAPVHTPGRAVAFNGGFFWPERVHRILDLAGFKPKCTWPTGNDAVLLWGHRPTTRRGEWVARKTGAAHIRVEDAFLRSLHPGRNGDAPLGLLIDHSACHFDSSRPSDLETILATAPLDDPALLNRAKDARTRITRAKLTKYAAVPWGAPCPDPGFILVVDQTRGDASIHKSGATDDTFHQMLSAAKAEHPNHRIVIKTHPETQAGFRGGHFDVGDVDDQVTLLDHAIAPTDLFAAAKAIYVVSSQLGFEAMLAGHKPVVFGQPFYCGWGLSDDRMPIPRRTRRLTVDQLCAAALILYPTWYDPCRDCLCELETVLDQLEAQTRDWRDDRHGWDAYGMRLWKRKSFQSFFGRQHPVRFEPKAPGPTRRSMVWGQKSAPVDAIRVEDGFLRSKGLGAQLIPPMSLVLDSLGIYFDPRTLSDLEVYIANSIALDPDQITRADAVRTRILENQLSKYNLIDGSCPDIPAGHRILVPGQVEDDASIQFGTIDICTNADLLMAVRAAFPDAVIIYKPHPDVEAGLRKGHVDAPERWADVVATDANPMALLDQVDQVCTMTSLLGFEALLRGKSVSCYGLPFYAGWGWTRDRHAIPRRRARPSLEGLIHATFIDYPRYFDPISGLSCSVEVILDRLSDPAPLPARPGLRALAKLQGIMASYAHLWRR